LAEPDNTSKLIIHVRGNKLQIAERNLTVFHRLKSNKPDLIALVALVESEKPRARRNPLSEFTGASMDDIQEQQTIRLADEFLHELVHELDHEDLVAHIPQCALAFFAISPVELLDNSTVLNGFPPQPKKNGGAWILA
jgi:hypothetical protein